MATFDIKIEKTIKLTEEDLSDILCSCFEGGCGYWCCVDNSTDEWNNAREQLHANGNQRPVIENIMLYMLIHGMPLRLIDEEEDVALYMTMDTFLTGIKMTLENGFCDCIDEIDAIAGDAIIQYAVFGEQVYG